MMARIGKARLGELLFRWRSYLPLAVFAGLLAGLWLSGPAATSNLRGWIVVGGLALAMFGLAVRVYAVGHAPRGTSGRHRTQHAERLNTFGIYSVVRHPLYVGNVLVWGGVSLTSGWLPGAVASVAVGVVMFALIVRHEDEYLGGRFGGEFEEWASVTPAFVPRPSLWRPARRPFRWGLAVASEYSTLHSIGVTALIFAALRGWRSGGAWQPGFQWWSLLVLNSGLYLGVRVWRSRRGRRLSGSPSSRAPNSGNQS